MRRAVSLRLRAFGYVTPLRDFEQTKRLIGDRVDILSVVSEHVRLRRVGRRWVGLCPFHSEKTPSFTVSPEMGIFKCFGCGRGGDLFSFVELVEHVPFGEAMRILADRAGVELHGGRGSTNDGLGPADVAKINAWALRYFRSNLQEERRGRPVREYVRTRGFSEETSARFALGYAPEGASGLPDAARRAGFSDKLLLAADLLRKNEDGRPYETFRNRLMFPIRDPMGRVVGFGGRALGEDRAKYLNTRQTVLFEKGRGLYGIDQARRAITERKRAIVVEGYTDCLAVSQAGFAETVATLGTALTEAQVELLRRYCEEVTFLFDSDEAGEAAADRAIHVALPRRVRVRLAQVSEGKDPSEFLERHGAEAFSDVLKGAVDALEFKWRKTQARYQKDRSNADRREAVLDFVRVVAEAADARAVDAIDRGLLVNQVAHLLRLNRADVDRLMRREQRRASRPSRTVRAGDSRVVPTDQEQAAWTRWLEVVLNAPAVLEAAETMPDIGAISDARDRRIAGIAVDLCGQSEALRVTDVLARCQQEGDAERVADLAARGAARGNYEGTFRLALECIRKAEQTRLLPSLGGAPPGPHSAPLLGDGATVGELIHERAKGHRHFAPRRLLQRAVPAPAPKVAAPSDGESTVEQR